MPLLTARPTEFLKREIRCDPDTEDVHCSRPESVSLLSRKLQMPLLTARPTEFLKRAMWSWHWGCPLFSSKVRITFAPQTSDATPDCATYRVPKTGDQMWSWHWGCPLFSSRVRITFAPQTSDATPDFLARTGAKFSRKWCATKTLDSDTLCAVLWTRSATVLIW